MSKSTTWIALGGALLSSQALAGVIEFTTLEGDRAAAWTNANCNQLQPDDKLQPKCVGALEQASAAAMGPGGGVLLAKHGNTTFEANPETGAVRAVLLGDEGQPIATRQITKLPEGQLQSRRFLISARVETITAPIGLAKASIGSARNVLTISFVSGKNLNALEEAELTYDADTFEAMVSVRALNNLDATRTGTLQYWDTGPQN